MIALDTAAYPAAERADLVHEVIARTGARRRVTLNAPAKSVHLRAETWQLGDAQVLRTDGTGLTLARTERDVRTDAPELVAIALSRGPCSYTVHGSTQQLGAHGLVVVDFSTPYIFAHAGEMGSSFTTHISHADLGVGVDVVRSAIPRLSASPVLPLIRGHLVRLSAAMDEVSGDPFVAAQLGAATIDLTRALIMSAVDGVPELSARTVRAQVVSYIRAHLGERDLTPARIAAAHFVSRRTLYNLWGKDDGSLADWIVRERLERVRRTLMANPGAASLFEVARACGFADPAHFSRRFRAAYGVSAREWLHEWRSGAEQEPVNGS